jgi:hemolysin D
MEGGQSRPAGIARVSPDRSQMQIDDNVVNLAPGLAVTVEVKTGSRTVIGYLLSPLLRYKHESLRDSE